MSAALEHEHADPVEVDVLLFQVGAQIYGADASQVIRVDRANVQAIEESALGPLSEGRRALVFADAEGYEAQLRVDDVLGIAPANADTLRRMPAATAFTSFAPGIWLREQQPVVLIDLLALATARTAPTSEAI